MSKEKFDEWARCFIHTQKSMLSDWNYRYVENGFWVGNEYRLYDEKLFLHFCDEPSVEFATYVNSDGHPNREYFFVHFSVALEEYSLRFHPYSKEFTLFSIKKDGFFNPVSVDKFYKYEEDTYNGETIQNFITKDIEQILRITDKFSHYILKHSKNRLRYVTGDDPFSYDNVLCGLKKLLYRSRNKAYADRR